MLCCSFAVVIQRTTHRHPPNWTQPRKISPPQLHQTQITRSKYRSLNQSIWENSITHLDEETDPKKIWTSINKQQGNTSKPKATYLRDHQVQKIFNNSGKDQILRQY